MSNLQTFERTEYQQVKADLHRKILDRLDLEKLGRTPGAAAREEVLLVIRNTVNSEAVPLSFAERERLAREILDEIFGLGPLEQLRKDPTISDILVKGRVNMLISGGTGAGKTTLLNVLSGFIPDDERVVSIEDAAELQLKQEHVVRLETRPPNIEGKGAVRQRQLVINSLRMRPDRIVVGEVRGEEAFDMLQAMNTGHEGSLTTVHANSQRDALARIENMVSMANLKLPKRAVRQQVASAMHAVVQIARLSDGSRKVIAICEVTGVEGEVICMQEIFLFERYGIDENGNVRGVCRASGVRQKCSDRLAIDRCSLSPSLCGS